MKRITILMLLPVMVYLSSCTNNDSINLTTKPVPDSVSKGGSVNMAFTVGYAVKNFLIKDLIVNKSAVYTMTASVSNVAPDSFWAAAITLTDHTSKQISMNLSMARDSTTELGVYVVTTNNSTLTDFSAGSNQTFSVLVGSTVDITYVSSYYIGGTMNLSLCYNHDTIPATGSFQIYH